MRVRLTIDLDLPDHNPQVHDKNFVGDVLYTHYVNYVTCSHMKDALQWCSKLNGFEQDDSGAAQIFRVHNTWGIIASQAKWSFELLPHEGGSPCSTGWPLN